MAIRPRYSSQRVGGVTPAPYAPARLAQSSGLQNLGAALAEVGAELERNKEKEDGLWAQQKFDEFQTDWLATSSQRANQALAAPNEVSRFDEEQRLQYEEASKSFLESLTSQRQVSRDTKMALERQLSAFGLRTNVAAIGVEKQRHKLATTDLLQGRLDTAVNQTITNPGAWQDEEARIIQLVADNRDALGESAVGIARTAKEQIRTAHVSGLIEQDARKTLADLKKGAFDSMLPADSRTRLMNAAEREVERLDRAAEAYRNSRIRLAEGEIQRVENDLALGLPVNATRIRALAGEVGGVEGELIGQRAALLEGQAQIWSQMSMMPAAQRQQFINDGYAQAQAGKLSDSQKETLLTVEKLNQKMTRAAEADMAGTAVRMGLVDVPAPADAQDLAAVEASMQRNAPLVKQVFGPEAEYLSNEVKGQIEQTLKEGNPADRFSLFQEVQQHDSLRTYVARAANEVNPALGVAFNLVGENPAVANQILAGLTVLDTIPEYKPSQRDAIDGLAESMGNAYSLSPSSQRGAIDASVALYVQRQGGKLPDVIDPSQIGDAFEEITGGVMRFNGSDIPAPVPGQSASEFRGMLESMSEKDWFATERSKGFTEALDPSRVGRLFGAPTSLSRAAGSPPVAFVFDPSLRQEVPTEGAIKLPTGDTLSWQDIASDAQLIYTGDGGYWVMLNGGKVVDDKQRPLVLRFPRGQ